MLPFLLFCYLKVIELQRGVLSQLGLDPDYGCSRLNRMSKSLSSFVYCSCCFYTFSLPSSSLSLPPPLSSLLPFLLQPSLLFYTSFPTGHTHTNTQISQLYNSLTHPFTLSLTGEMFPDDQELAFKMQQFAMCAQVACKYVHNFNLCVCVCRCEGWCEVCACEGESVCGVGRGSVCVNVCV